MTEFLEQYLLKLESQYPRVKELSDLKKRFELLISPENVAIPKSVFVRAEHLIKSVYALKNNDNYIKIVQDNVDPCHSELIKSQSHHDSVLMSYDFHYSTEEDKLSLIEINTNASAYLVADLLYDKSSFDHSLLPINTIDSLKNSFIESTQALGQPARIAIIDYKIQQQKMYAEFLMYCDLFENWGHSCSLVEETDLIPENFDVIYNRSTDFLMTEPHNQKLRCHYIKEPNRVTPHPKDYLFFADKRQLNIMAQFLKSDLIPHSEVVQAEKIEAYWMERKNLFFKPVQSFGSKGAYKGSSISRKMFDAIANQNYLAQQFIAPGNWKDWKFDLRFYVFRDNIHLYCARVYRGQVTSFNTPGGGLARVTFV